MELCWDKRGVKKDNTRLALYVLHQENFIMSAISGGFSDRSHLCNTRSDFDETLC